MSMQLSIQFCEMIHSLSMDGIYKKIISAAQRIYCIRQLSLQTLSPSQVLQLLKKHLQRDGERSTSAGEGYRAVPQSCWALNEFKLFSWVSVCRAYLTRKQLHQFNSNDYAFLNALFPRKSQEFLQYHTRSLLKESKATREKWTVSETALLVESVRLAPSTESGLRWSEVSLSLFVRSGKSYYRTPQKCREKWVNHLDPEVNREKWTAAEDLQLFRLISSHGTKWALISKIFQGARTEHMVKNRYNSIYKRYQSRSQRASAKKIIDRILEDLQKRIDPPHSSIPTTNELPFHIKIQEESASHESQPSEASQPRKQNEQQQRTIEEGSRLDLHKMMFSDKMEEVKEQACPTLQDIELVEVELFLDRHPTIEDDYLNSLLY